MLCSVLIEQRKSVNEEYKFKNKKLSLNRKKKKPVHTSLPSGVTMISCGLSNKPSFGANFAITLFVCM